MKAIRLALSFILVPRLFISLLLWPLVIGIFIALGQLVLSTKYIQLTQTSSKEYKEKVEEKGEEMALLNYLYNVKEPLPEIIVCRWENDFLDSHPTNDNCIVENNDASLRVSEPLSFDATGYVNFLNGATYRLHICKNCLTKITFAVEEEELTTNITSFSGLIVLLLAEALEGKELNNYYSQAKEQITEMKDLQGTIYLYPPGLLKGVNISDATTIMLLITNTAFIIIITLWLALRAHRKVLDYFAENNALLPLVASCGKNTFYLSLWIITLLRVIFFLLASIPITISLFSHIVPPDILQHFIGKPLQFILWLFGIVSSLSSCVIIASIAELKHRHVMISFLYKYIPILLCIFGSLIWFVAIFEGGETMILIQETIAMIPIIGLSPIILGPLIQIGNNTIVVHALLSSIVAIFALRANARWFAAHLEEL